MGVKSVPQSRRYRWCEIHNKRGWWDQEAADAAVARLVERDHGETDRLMVYPCGVRAGLHVGHKPGAPALDRVTRAGES